MKDRYKDILNGDSSEFLKTLSGKFSTRIQLLLKNRKRNPVLYFLPETEHIRKGSWTIDEPPKQIEDRRVEITGPVDRKMVINALNSGANVFMADFEDSNSPTWDNCLDGQINLYDAVRGEIEFTNFNGKEYKLNDDVATLFVRPRGLHLVEKNFEGFSGTPIEAALFDFGLFAFNNATAMVSRGNIPCFYLPKLEHYKEAELWKDIFSFTESYLGIEQETFKATVLVETLPLAFQMNEVIHELGNYSAGLNCGRWDYIFSFIKNNPFKPMPDRDQVTMNQHFMRSYTQLLVQTCHKRGVHAMGGMAAQIPIKNDDKANEAALRKVRDDKMREVLDGHDGTWVAHPGLIAIAKDVFDTHMPESNQINKKKNNFNVEVSREDLTCVPVGTCTEKCLRDNINIGYTYLKSWLGGNGCVPINNLMEDAATAEISRTQIWQWIQNEVTLDTGFKVTKEYFEQVFLEEIEKYEYDKLTEDIFKEICTSIHLEDFLTTACYKHI